MTDKKLVWGQSPDGRFDYVSITDDMLPECLQLLKTSFCLDEPVSICTGISQDPKGQEELSVLSKVTYEDGASIAAVEKSTGKIVSVAFNKVQKVLAPDESHFFDEFAAGLKEESSKALTLFMYEMDSRFDTLAHYKITSLLEIMFLFTDQNYRKQGLGFGVCEASIKLAEAQANGSFILPKNMDLKLGGLAALCTSGYSYLILKKLGFDALLKSSYDTFSYKGKTYLEIRPTTDQVVLVGKRI